MMSSQRKEKERRKLMKTRYFVNMLVEIRVRNNISRSNYNAPESAIPLEAVLPHITRKILQKLNDASFYATTPVDSLLNVDIVATPGSPLTTFQHQKIIMVIDAMSAEYLQNLKQGTAATKKNKGIKIKAEMASEARIYYGY